MFELLEVEISCCGIELYLVGVIILYVVVCNGWLCWLVFEEIYCLSDVLVFSVCCCVKYLFLELLDGWIIVYFGMLGSLCILSEELFVEKYDYVDLVMSNGKVLCYIDLCCFGVWLWIRMLEGYLVLVYFGLELFSDVFNVDYFQ